MLPRYRNATIAIHKRLVRFEAAPSNLMYCLKNIIFLNINLIFIFRNCHRAIEQGQEPEEFWQILGGKAPVAAVADYNKDYSPAMLNAVKPESLLNKYDCVVCELIVVCLMIVVDIRRANE